MKNSQFEKFKSIIKNENSFNMSNGLPNSLLLKKEGELSVYYAPFEYVNKNAKLVIVGITPGLQQAVNALNQAKIGIENNLGNDDILLSAKGVGSFSGPMRNNLINMLQYMNIHKKLDINSCAELFSTQMDKVHFTSVLSNPVFYKGKNYNGTPSMLNTPILKQLINECFMQNIQQLNGALFVPLGPKVTAVMQYLSQQGQLQEKQILNGFPHPSGANAERIAYFLGKKTKEALSVKTNPDQIDFHKNALLTKLDAFSFA